MLVAQNETVPVHFFSSLGSRKKNEPNQLTHTITKFLPWLMQTDDFNKINFQSINEPGPHCRSEFEVSLK